MRKGTVTLGLKQAQHSLCMDNAMLATSPCGMHTGAHTHTLNTLLHPRRAHTRRHAHTRTHRHKHKHAIARTATCLLQATLEAAEAARVNGRGIQAVRRASGLLPLPRPPRQRQRRQPSAGGDGSNDSSDDSGGCGGCAGASPGVSQASEEAAGSEAPWPSSSISSEETSGRTHPGCPADSPAALQGRDRGSSRGRGRGRGKGGQAMCGRGGRGKHVNGCKTGAQANAGAAAAQGIKEGRATRGEVGGTAGRVGREGSRQQEEQARVTAGRAGRGGRGSSRQRDEEAEVAAGRGGRGGKGGSRQELQGRGQQQQDVGAQRILSAQDDKKARGHGMGKKQEKQKEEEGEEEEEEEEEEYYLKRIKAHMCVPTWSAK